MAPGREMRWWGWGEDVRAGNAPRHGLDWLEQQLGSALGEPQAPVPADAVQLSDSQLTQATGAKLGAITGPDGLRTDAHARLVRAAGKGYPDLVRMRAGDARPAPDGVVFPASHEQVRAVLELCAQASVAVVPFGGGTSVVGGVEPLRGSHAAVIALDLGRMSRLVELDTRSRLATLEPGLRGPELEYLLRAHGWTLGHLPQSFEYSTVGGWVATRSAGQASTGYGRIDALVRGARLAAPAGELHLAPVPASAAGPDLRELVVGSEGALGVITQVTLDVTPRLRHGIYEAFVLPSFAAGADALRELEQAGVAPDVARLSDEHETQMSLALAALAGARAAAADRYLALRGVRGGALVILGWEGDEQAVLRRRRATRALLRRHGAAPLGRAPGRAWARGRFHAPYLRDELLARGVMVETLETATTWANLPVLYREVREALGRHAPFVACHISHLYRSGASLYFTFLAPQQRDDPIAQWQAAKRDACGAIVAAGGTITHHHAIGRDHAAYLALEVGDSGIELLRAAKERLDPAGIMNPGKLLEGVSRAGEPRRAGT